MTDHLEVVRKLFGAALARLEKEGRSTPTAWETHNLTAALSSIASEDFDRAEAALKDFARRPLASEIAQLPFSKGRPSTAEMRHAFERIEWKL